MQTDDALRTDIRRYYDQGREDARLRQGRGRLEFWRTQDVLRRSLPEPPARVLDVGGGSGVHAEWLAADGYQVTVVDPVPLHVEQARRLPDVDAVEGDARELDTPDASVDVVLLLGPLYHLPDPADRVRAVAEARRAVRPGGLVAIAAISRFASAHDSMRQGWLTEPDWVAGVESTLVDGRHHGLRYGEAGRFTTAYFHRPEEVAAELQAGGLVVEAVVGVEGVAGLLGNVEELLDDTESRQVLLRWLRRLESEPSLLGASDHLLGLARRHPSE